jgi:hypothetical protein
LEKKEERKGFMRRILTLVSSERKSLSSEESRKSDGPAQGIRESAKKVHRLTSLRIEEEVYHLIP